MPTDLDELFQGLGRQADAIPIAPPEAARLRGRQRRRNRAVIAAAVAVCLVAAGVSGLLNRPGRQPDSTVAPSGPGLSAVGSPISLGNPVTVDYSVTAGGRVFTLWQAADGTVNLLAADLRTGAQAWKTQRPAKPDAFMHLYAMSQGIALLAEGRISVYDPADGRLRWEMPYSEADGLTVQTRAVVRWSAQTRRIEAFGWQDGKRLWSLETAGDKLVTVRSGTEIRQEDLAGKRVVQVSATGKGQVVDLDSGTAGETFSIPAAAANGTITAFEEWLISEETWPDRSGYRLHATDLRTGDTRVIAERESGHTLGQADLCGPNRLCVLDKQDATTTVTAIDLATREQVWEVPGPDGAEGIEAHDGYLLTGGGGAGTLYDRNGQVVYRAPDSAVSWLTAESLLRVAGSGEVERIRVANGHTERVGTVPLQIGVCAAVPDRLACPTSEGLRIWSLSG
ncbi:PQQ-binding-like beta-propeller repeat protein [Actinoplanes sp. NPDC024001]|uniref:outer membrane protein assembly factor BamB family protein n=1 Tax=Actinoplanes sp. NPDC024001 TaxID=3154598 RepID=UPI0033FE3E82